MKQGQVELDCEEIAAKAFPRLRAADGDPVRQRLILMYWLCEAWGCGSQTALEDAKAIYDREFSK